MKTARIVLLFVIVAVALIGGYFSANMYVKNIAIKKINRVIEKNHWENLVEYGNVKANILKGDITIQNVKFTVQNNMTSKTIGVMDVKTIVVNGDLDKSYSVKAYDTDFINLNDKLQEEMSNKKLFNIKTAYFKISKKNGIIDNFDAEIKNIMLNTKLINLMNNDEKKKLEDIEKIIKIDNPINVTMKYKSYPEKGILNLERYSIDFVNNAGIAYKAYLKNVDLKGIKSAADQLKKNPKNFMVIANIMSKFMEIKPVKLDIAISNHGMLDRLLEESAKKKHMTKDKLIDTALNRIKAGRLSFAYNPIKNFLTSKSKSINVHIDNQKGLSIGDIVTQARNHGSILKILSIKFSN